ncbi:ATP synthase A1 subunit C, partial [Candidatus Woesearchaeota archaeon]|nr:ATP synthase A1 subunit C [Candidatus Woesearchaeota archaeon]
KMWETEKIRKIKLGFYPYTYARVSAMKGKLIKPEDYQKLLKMRPGEITKFLEELEYKKEIDALGVQYTGADLLERALNMNLAMAYEKLRRISPPELRALIDAYLRRKDVWNIKTILRGKFVGEKPGEIKKLLMPAGTYSIAFLEGLAEKESMKDIIFALNIPALKAAYSAFEKNKDIFALENLLDHGYYTEMLEFTKQLPKQGKLFAAFLRKEIDVLNITNLFRLKRAGIEKDKIMQYLFFPGEELTMRTVKRLLDLSIEELFKELEKLNFEKIVRKLEQEREKSLVSLELELKKNLLDEAVLLLHQHPLSVNVILGYMFAKEVEIKNLKTIIKGKQLGVEERFIERCLVIGG